jgi:ribonucleases P/MRP protein subunit RPP25
MMHEFVRSENFKARLTMKPYADEVDNKFFFLLYFQTMENYKKGKNIEEELTQDRIPIENLPEKFLWMHVKGGTKVSNVVEFAEKAFDSGEYRSVVWSGSGGGVPKTISCSEIMKRNFEVHQVTKLAYQK